MGLSEEQVKHVDRYICPGCAPETVKKSNGPSHMTPDAKVYSVQLLHIHLP